MSKIINKDYNLNDMLGFANSMNSAAAIDAPKVTKLGTATPSISGAGVAANTFTPVNTTGGARLFGDIAQNFRGFVKQSNLGAGIRYQSPVKINTVSEISAPEVEEVSPRDSAMKQMGESEPLQLTPEAAKDNAITNSGAVTKPIENVQALSDEQAESIVWQTSRGFTPAPDASTDVENAVTAEVEAETGGPLTYEQWRSQYGIDVDKEFEQAKAQLEYEMRTWSQNYGANAEKLAQMGLTNSGVVDIYGSGVLNAYVSAMNDLFNAKIDTEQEQATAYEAYVNQYEADKAAKTQTFNNNVTAAYSYGMNLYDGSNLEAVKTMMANAGYDADVVEAAALRLMAVDSTMLPVLQARAQQEAEADAAKKTAINEAVQALIGAGYTPEMRDAALEWYASIYGEEDAAAILKGANALYGLGNAGRVTTAPVEYTDAEGNTVTLSEAQGEAANALASAYEEALGDVAYNPEIHASLVAEYAQRNNIGDKAVIDGALAILERSAGVREAAGAAAEAAQNKENFNATITGIKDKDIGTVTVSAIEGELAQDKELYGADSVEYKAIQAEISSKTIDLFNYALEANRDGTAKRLTDPKTLEQLGLDPTILDGVDPADAAGVIEREMYSIAAEMKEAGVLTSEDFTDFMRGQLLSEIEAAQDSGKNKYRKQTYNAAAAAADTLYEQYNSGLLTDEEYNELLGDVVDQAEISIFGNQLSYYNGKKTKYTDVFIVSTLRGTKVSDEVSRLIDEADGKIITMYMNSSSIRVKVKEFDGKLYHLSESGGNWRELDRNNLAVAKENTETGVSGTYEILKYLLRGE